MINRKAMIGFTLIELLISVAIVGILASIAYPSYTDFVVRSKRTEGHNALTSTANRQEQFFLDNRTYTADMTQLGLGVDPFITPEGDYSVDAIIANGGATFVLTATAQGSQATNDSDCATLTINEVGQRTPAVGCWEN